MVSASVAQALINKVLKKMVVMAKQGSLDDVLFMKFGLFLKRSKNFTRLQSAVL
jgi:hypothetical protein